MPPAHVALLTRQERAVVHGHRVWTSFPTGHAGDLKHKPVQKLHVRETQKTGRLQATWRTIAQQTPLQQESTRTLYVKEQPAPERLVMSDMLLRWEVWEGNL